MTTQQSLWTPIPIGESYRLEGAFLAVKGHPTFDEAQQLGDWLRQLGQRSPWWLGDWYNHVRDAFPETGAELDEALEQLGSDVKREPTPNYTQLLEGLGYVEETLERFGRTCRAIPPSERHHIDEVSFNSYQATAKLTKRDRKKVISAAVDEQLSVAQVRERVRNLKRKVVSEGEADLFGRYRVIYAKPDFDRITVAELGDIPIQAHAREHAACFLWLGERERGSADWILERWGFEHRTAFIWDRVLHQRPGAYLSERHEHLVWAVRGKCPPDELVGKSGMRDSVQTFRQDADDPGKPEEFRTLIESLYTRGPYLELFATAKPKRKGWTFYGQRIGAEPAEKVG